ncbi:hypothetical protein B9479_005503 [Cryptococcus floricola]|uniref:Membrane anchor Opy2 N-terminal domain-containing protein n=1 Tax=Cryptococcus floricola TaxID=2591691 RepID=A0A5D3AUJ5_9TREE|nr:hypothetical protein B9479_005503 [Cryptococcus floricola]
MLPHPHDIFPRMDKRDDCVTCNSTSPTCNCASGEKCVLTSRTCNECPSIQCIKSASSSSGSSVNAGVIAGPVVAVLVIASLGLFWWLRRKKRRDMKRVEGLADRARKAESAGFQLSPSRSPPPSTHPSSSFPLPPPSASRRSPLPPAPVNAEYYDQNGSTIRVYSNNGTINADPNGDPFSDRQSISTMGSGGTANIIPIQYIPPSESKDGLSKVASKDNGETAQSAAARLDQARQNLSKLGAPSRPARSPDLDLRLNPPNAPSAFDPGALRSPGSGAGSANWRDSYLSGNSAAPSYFSGQSDFQLDQPKIVTSRQVQVGRLQQAEVVNFGAGGREGVLSPVRDEEDPFDRTPPAPGLSPSDASFCSTGERTLTPTNRKFGASPSASSASASASSPTTANGPNGNGQEERLDAMSEGSSGDLRFSMGSLDYRNSVSTMGTSRYLASAVTVPVLGHATAATATTPNPAFPDSATTPLPLPLPTPTSSSASPLPSSALPSALPSSQYNSSSGTGMATADTRGSVLSSRSFADSFLGAFPMIPPDQQRPPVPSVVSRGANSPLSPSSSSSQGQGQGQGQGGGGGQGNVEMISSRPPIAYRPPPPGPRPPSSARGSGMERPSLDDERAAGGGRKRPETQDSFLGTFPFVPPNMDDLAGMPEAPEAGVGGGSGVGDGGGVGSPVRGGSGGSGVGEGKK